MLYWAAAFFLISVVAGFFGFSNVSSGAANIAKILFGLFLILFIGALIMAFFVLA